MDFWLTLLSIFFLGASSYFSYTKLTQQSKSGTPFWTLLLAFAIQTSVIGIRGEAQGACPIKDTGEILMFLAWSLLLVYLVMGTCYRISLLGFFTQPVAALLLIVALIPGVYQAMPAQPIEEANPWLEAHASLYILGYGVLLLSAISSLMFLLLNKKLKSRELSGALFKHMAPMNTLNTSSMRLIIFALLLLTVAMISGYQIEQTGTTIKNWIGRISWLGYLGFLLVANIKGIPPVKTAVTNLSIFAFSLLAISFV